MSYDTFSSKLMSMSDTVWACHANPASGWSRAATSPLLFLAFWSWTWIGWWALAPITAIGFWLWLNPRIFRPYRDDSAWMTRGVLGERIFIKRHETPIPGEHVRIAHLLSALAFVSIAGAVIGFVTKSFWLALGGWLLAMTFKFWFFDRMVWIYDVMKDATPEYRNWSGAKDACL